MDTNNEPDEGIAMLESLLVIDELHEALRAIIAVLDGRQPRDIPGALMIARTALQQAAP